MDFERSYSFANIIYTLFLDYPLPGISYSSPGLFSSEIESSKEMAPCSVCCRVFKPGTRSSFLRFIVYFGCLRSPRVFCCLYRRRFCLHLLLPVLLSGDSRCSCSGLRTLSCTPLYCGLTWTPLVHHTSTQSLLASVVPS